MDMEFANERERLKKEVGIFGRVENFLLGVFFLWWKKSSPLKTPTRGVFLFPSYVPKVLWPGSKKFFF